MEEATRHTCLKLIVGNDSDTIFVKGTWFHSRFDLTVTNGLQAWLCRASEEEVRDRAAQWDQSVAEYIDFAERHLGFPQPASSYKFADAGDACRRLSWTFEKEGTKLEWRWKCQLASDCKTSTAGILDFLMDANIRLSDEVVKKAQSYESLKVEAEKCVAQSERFANDRTEFESAIYTKKSGMKWQRLHAINIRPLVPIPTFAVTSDKRRNSRMKSVKIEFLGVLNSKKAKLRELRDQFSKQKSAGKLPKQQEEESTDRTESFDDESEEEPADNVTSTSKDILTQGQGQGCGHGGGRRRIARK